MTRRKVFISYRRDDAAGFAHAIHDRLVENLPKDQVFMDVVGIDPGVDFVEKLKSTVNQCSVMLALIGKRWLGENGEGKTRIHEPHDWIHTEVSAAIERGVRVIPVMLDGASMPAAESLPEDLRPLTRMNAVDVRGSRLDADVWDLTGATITALGGKWPPDEPGGKIYSVLAGLYALFAGGVALLVMIGAMFTPEVGAPAVLGTGVFVLNAALLLRLPVHAWVRTLSRQKALKIGALVHLLGFGIIGIGSTDTEGVMVIFFGIVPAVTLFLASFAMRRVVRN
jgi:hypothetical protein